MNALNVIIEVSNLCKLMRTKLARIRLVTVVNSEVLTKTARLLERLITLFEQALEEVYVSTSQGIRNFDGSMPVVWNLIKMLSLMVNFLLHGWYSSRG